MLLVFSSCEETTGKGNLRIILETSGSTKSIRPDDQSSTVVKYNVKGVGPNGKTFSRDSSSRSITIDGLSMGTWTVTANGYNSESVGILTGSKTFSFDNTTKSVYVNMTSYSGTGAIQVTVKWDKEITSPVLQTTLSDGSTTVSNSYSLQSGSTSYKYSQSSLKAGTYFLFTKLYNEESFISGCVEVVQVVNNKTTTGEISLNSTAQSTSTVSSDSAFPGSFSVEGFSQLPSTVEAMKKTTVKFVLEDNQDNVSYSWFLDGSELSSTTKTVSITPELGDHILNLVLENSETTASLFYKFTAKTNAKKGSAILSTKILSTSTKLVLSEDSMIGALPDNHFILITPSRSSMQVFTIVKNNPIVEGNLTYNATDLQFTWIPQVTAVYSNPAMNFFVAVSNQNTAHILFFNQTTKKIEIAYRNSEPLVLSDYIEFPPAFIDNITSVSLMPSSNYAGSIFIHDSGARSSEMIGILTSENEIKSLGSSALSEGMTLFSSSDASGNILATVVDSKTLYFAKVQNCATSSSWYSFNDDTITPIKSFRFLNSHYAVFQSSNALKIYEYYSQQKLWISRIRIDIASSCFNVSSNEAFIYVADLDNNLLSYRSGLTDNFGKIYSQTVDDQITKTVLNNQTILGLDGSGNLYIFDITQEDTAL